VGKASLHLRWHSKEALLTDVVTMWMSRVTDVDTGTLRGDLPATPEELLAALRVNEKTTVGLVRTAVGLVGEVVANLVHFYNPARIVGGGGLTIPGDDMLAGIRAAVYQRALPLATRNLVIGYPTLGEWSGTSGGLVLGIEHALTPDPLGTAIAAHRHRYRH
jgi:predicted NBD/HSP70 family sugar kinase